MLSERHNSVVTRGYARYVLAVMVGINFLNYLDRYVGAAIATPIQNEFRLSDAQVGLLATAFLLVYAIAALPFGYCGVRGVLKTAVGSAVPFRTVPVAVSCFA